MIHADSGPSVPGHTNARQFLLSGSEKRIQVLDDTGDDRVQLSMHVSGPLEFKSVDALLTPAEAALVGISLLTAAWRGWRRR